MRGREWIDDANCRNDERDLHFVCEDKDIPLKQRRQLTAEAKRICFSCPVLDVCREEVLKIDQLLGVQRGIWGGLDPLTREKIFKAQRAQRYQRRMGSVNAA